jgi:acetylornithine deacetylase/succinyl-diaminopimelate desuccinylase-like protein
MSHGKRISNDIQVSEKYVLNFRFEVHNKGGHSSMPVPDNAIYHLAGALDRLSRFAFPLKTNEVTRVYFDRMSKIQTGPIAAGLALVAQGSPEALQRVAAANTAWNATLRTTCVATQLEGGHALNALPQLAAANVNCRVLPEDSVAFVQESLRKVVADDQVDVKILSQFVQAPSSPMRPDVLKAVNRVTDTLWPGVPSVPMMVMGATDGRYLRAENIPTYGLQGFFMDASDMRMHGRDERMGVTSFYEGQTFLYDVVKILAKQGE